MEPLMRRLSGSMPKSQVGIVFSFEQEYAFQIQPHHQDLNYTGQLLKYYQAFYKQNIPVDFVPQQGDFERYQLLVAPLQYLMSPELEDKYFNYVRQGGHLILTMRTGVKDLHNLCMADRELPGRLSELAGVEVLDYDCLRETHVDVLFEGQKLQANIWSDLMRFMPETKVVASYASEFYAGEPCITVHPFGEGLCYYVGTEPGEELMEALITQICQKAGIEPICPAVPEVECMVRENDEMYFLFAINHSSEPKSYTVPQGYRLLRGEQAGKLGAYEVQILEKVKKGK